MAAAASPVLLGLRDSEMRSSFEQPRDGAWAVNKIGGLPDSMPTVPAPQPCCGRCGAAMAHVVQVYCPLEGSPFHRLLHVFACIHSACVGQPCSWKVFRSQFLQRQEDCVQDAKLIQKEENNFAVKDWCEGAEDWGDNNESDLEPWINVAEDTEYHAQKLLREYGQREGVEVELLMAQSFILDNREKYEKAVIKNNDKIFYKFMKRISACREQILRYSWNGKPLFITCPADATEIPYCSNCGSSRVFEFQLMPTLVSLLKITHLDISVEFGTILIYTCEKSCWPANHQSPMEEFCVIQEDPDQMLFK